MRYERPDGSWDMDREEADHQQAALEAAGREAYRMQRRSMGARLRGNPPEAAALCPHGASGLVGGRPVCRDCGSILDDSRRIVLVPCVYPHACLKCYGPLSIADGRGKCPNGHDWYLTAKPSPAAS